MLFQNPLLLLGLVAVLIPPAVHLLARRYDEVGWGAMRFLRLTPRSRRKLLFEQWLLVGARMAALGLLAVALAGPAVRTSLLTPAGGRGPRDTVILVDCSAGMGYRHEGGAAADAARQWAADFVARMRPGDRVAVFAVTGDVSPVVGSLTPDPEQARAALELLPEPRGAADWPAAVETAARLLETADGEPEVLLLTDGRRAGWADAETLARWELLARAAAARGTALPRVWVADVAADRPADPPAAWLDPTTANRAVATAGAAVRFECMVRQIGGGDLPRVRLEVGGRAAGELPPPPAAKPGADFTLAFERRFPPGSHLVTLRLDPPGQGAADRQDFALDVLPVIPVLLVDGETRPDARSLGTDFLRDALAPAKDPGPAFAVRSVTVGQFTPATLVQDVKGPGTAPRVLALGNVGRLTAEQAAAVERFAADGGGVLVAPGERVDADEWNRAAYRGGRGWLPARFAEVAGGDDPNAGARPRTAAFDHPALRVFREGLPGGLHTAHFPRYWRLEPDPLLPRSAVLGPLSTGDPFLVERPVGAGRVVVAAVPLDNTWRANLVTLPDFVRLAHELAFYLAGSRAAGGNLAPGEPIVFRPPGDEPPAPVTILRPDGLAAAVPVPAWPAVYRSTHDPGAYRLTTGTGRVRYYAVRPDPRAADLTPADEADRGRVAQVLGAVEYVGTVDGLRARRGRGPVTWELDGALLAAVLALLLAEVWYTRRLTGPRG